MIILDDWHMAPLPPFMRLLQKSFGAKHRPDGLVNGIAGTGVPVIDRHLQEARGLIGLELLHPMGDSDCTPALASYLNCSSQGVYWNFLLF